MRLQITSLRKLPNLPLLLALLISVSSNASDVKLIEKAVKTQNKSVKKVYVDSQLGWDQRNLRNLVNTLRVAKNTGIQANINTLHYLDSHEQLLNVQEEQIQYCSSLMEAITKGNTRMITIPRPVMTTAIHGNEAILKQVKELISSCQKDRPGDITEPFFWKQVTGDLKFPHSYGIYNLANEKGARTVILNKTFVNDGYERIKRVSWTELDSDGCFWGSGEADYSKGGDTSDKRQAGVMLFAGQVSFYEVENYDDMMFDPAHDACYYEDSYVTPSQYQSGASQYLCDEHYWRVSIFVPSKSVSIPKVLEPIAGEYIRGIRDDDIRQTWRWACRISFK